MKSFLTLAFVTLFLISCSKDDDRQPAQTTEGVVLYDNVKIVDNEVMQLNTSQELLETGIYKFTISGTAPEIKIGDVIVGDQNGGFLRKVTSVNLTGSAMTLQTTQGSMTDVFKKGAFNFDTGMDGMTQGKTAAEGFGYTIDDFVLYNEGPLNITLNSGQVSLNPNWHFNFDFDENGVQLFEMKAQDAILDGSFTATVTTQQAVNTSYNSSVLANDTPFTKTYTVWVPAVLLGVPVEVPVVVVVEVDVIADFSASINAAVSRQATFESNNVFDLGFSYSGGQWDGLYDLDSDNSYTQGQTSGNAGFTVNLGLTPKISAKLYGVVGPNASLGLKEELKGNIASPALDWDFTADVWLKTTLGVAAGFSILDYDVTASYTETWETDRLSYTTPFKIESISGSNQIGQQGQALPQPVKVRVLDNLDNPQKNVPVYFTVIEGGGTVEAESILTDDEGYAETTWTLGNEVAHELHATAKKADGTVISGSPAVFFATAEDVPFDCDGLTTYPQITIGAQIWMQKNLDICYYRNGDPIPEVQDAAEWASLTTGAWCYYENNTANGPVYGKLYNWYAVNDPRGLAPEDWHIPTGTEWENLISYLGGSEAANAKIKSLTSDWNSLDGATNSSGFTGLPGGYRGSNDIISHFSAPGDMGVWWSSTEIDGEAWGLLVESGTESLWALQCVKKCGYSIRCIKD